jgi:hypothetical protein
MERNLARKTLAIIAFALLLAALTPAAHAEIVYTPVNVVVVDSTYSLDLNNDGITDFTIKGPNSPRGCPGGGHGDIATIKVVPVTGNGVEGGWHAAALDAGSVIGSGQQFYGSVSQMEHIKIGYFWHYVYPYGYCYYADVQVGNWFDVTGYLGLQFQINGETHYGWAAVSVQFQPYFPFSATITGYAYETIPGQSIVAGQTSGT